MLVSQTLDKAQELSPGALGLNGKQLGAPGLDSLGRSFLFPQHPAPSTLQLAWIIMRLNRIKKA